MAFNPFLSMADPVAPVAPISTEAVNPFMMADSEPMEFYGDNPFATSNPFSDFGSEFEPPTGDTVPMNIFGASEPIGGQTNIFGVSEQMDVETNVFGTSEQIGEQSNIFGASDQVEASFNIFSTSEPVAGETNVSLSSEATPMEIFGSIASEPVKPNQLDLTSTTVENNVIPQRPPRPSRPLPPETQNLIQSVTGQMDFASTHLLDRIPLTRTPSPVSARDIQSPSMTPEPPEIDDIPQEEFTQPKQDLDKNKTARQPPARPPPPPTPRPIPVQVQAQPQAAPQQPEDINLFDAPAAVVVKPTTEDILSLYSTPKKVDKPVDFLSDDISTVVAQKYGNENNGSSVSVSESDNSTVVEANVSLFSESQSDIVFTAENTNNGDANQTDVPMDYTENVFESVPSSLKNSPFNTFEGDDMENVNSYTDVNNPFASTDYTHEVEQSYEHSPFTAVADNIDTRNSSIFGVPQSTNDTENASEMNRNNKPYDAFEAEQSILYDMNQAQPFSEYTPQLDETSIIDDQWGATERSTDNARDQWGNESTTYTPNVTNYNQWNTPAVKTQDGHWDNMPQTVSGQHDAFEAFEAKFDSALPTQNVSAAWGDDGMQTDHGVGFEAEAFDPFLSMAAPPPPAATPRLDHQGSLDSVDDNFSVVIRPKDENGENQAVPALAPPPRPQALPESPRANPFDKSSDDQIQQMDFAQDEERTSDSEHRGDETPPTPLFDEDTSVPLEDFPRTKYTGQGWEMQLRQPNKKKITGQRFWKKIFVRISYQGDNAVVQLYKTPEDKEPFQELPLQPCYSVSEIAAQQFDQFGKIFTVKLQYVFYKERPGVRPGQVTKAERITNKLSQFAAYAIQGDYQGVKEFGSDLRKLGLPVEHAPQMSQLFKLGSLNYEDVKQFSCCIEEALFKITAHRDRALTYKMEEVQITAVDELYVEQDAEGIVLKQIARVRLFFLGFLSGMPDVEIGLNDLRRQGKEVVGRHDIIPVVTEEWIRVEDTEFHACVQPEEFAKCQILRFKPPDACYMELLRFRVRPPKNRELPLQLKAVWCVTGNKVELRADILVPGFASRKLGQIPCEDVSIRFPIPECWIYLFRVEKHFRYGSVKSAHRRTGKIKGIERFLGAVDTLQESLIEVTSGQAKYEHQHRAIVWRMPRLPKEGQGAYTTHNLVSRMALTSYDQIPAELAKFAFVEFTMPMTQVSHMTVRSVSLQNHDNDPPEKYVRYLARHEYIVGIERTSGKDAPTYEIVTKVEPKPQPAAPAPLPTVPSSESDSD